MPSASVPIFPVPSLIVVVVVMLRPPTTKALVVPPVVVVVAALEVGAIVVIVVEVIAMPVLPVIVFAIPSRGAGNAGPASAPARVNANMVKNLALPGRTGSECIYAETTQRMCHSATCPKCAWPGCSIPS